MMHYIVICTIKLYTKHYYNRFKDKLLSSQNHNFNLHLRLKTLTPRNFVKHLVLAFRPQFSDKPTFERSFDRIFSHCIQSV